jgi:Flp pilus assembly protein TadG
MGNRRGSALVLVVILLPCLMAILALAVDLGTLYTAKSQLQAAVDASALAGASGLSKGNDEAISRAIACAAKNSVNGASLALQGSNIELGQWDPGTRKIIAPPLGLWSSAVRVAAQTEVHFILAGMFGMRSSHASASAVAVVGARDIVLTLDYSGSMADDSQLPQIPKLGRQQVETALQNIWSDMVRGNHVTFPNLTRDVVISSTNDTQVMQQLSLSGKPWPSDWGGSWSDYFSYVRNLGSYGGTSYKNHYGYLTLMNYLQDKQWGSTKTPDLAHVREQPITAMKEAVEIFRDFMEDPKTDDRLGLAAYTYSDGTGICEVHLTYEYNEVSSTLNDRQAGNYYDYTNIAGGMTKARQELENNGRDVALKLIVLLTDGQANWYRGRYDEFGAKSEAKSEAARAKSDGIPIVTISLGTQADTSLMQYIADTTGGVHFIVPGGSSPQAYKDQLVQVFANIAGHRPVKLVQ